MKTIVITGATSMIGAALVRCAVKQGINVLCIVKNGSARLGNLPQSNLIEIKYANLDEYSQVMPNKRQYDIFYHFAWEKTFGDSRDDTDTQTTNIQYTLDAVRLAKRFGCKKFIGAGSQAEYGIVTEPLKSTMPVNPESGYGIAKYAAGKLCQLLCKQIDLQFNWVRITSTYGPLDSTHMLIMYTVNELRLGHSPEFTKCEQIWDYLHCDDAARAFIAIGDKGTDGRIYPLGSGNYRKLSEYLETIRNIVAPDLVLQFGKKEYYPHQPMYLCADITELTQDTGWKPEISFENGIKKILEQ